MTYKYILYYTYTQCTYLILPPQAVRGHDLLHGTKLESPGGGSPRGDPRRRGPIVVDIIDVFGNILIIVDIIP